MNFKSSLVAAVAALLFALKQVSAIQGIIAKVDGTDVVISRPSTGNESYLQSRARLVAPAAWRPDQLAVSLHFVRSRIRQAGSPVAAWIDHRREHISTLPA